MSVIRGEVVDNNRTLTDNLNRIAAAINARGIILIVRMITIVFEREQRRLLEGDEKPCFRI